MTKRWMVVLFVIVLFMAILTAYFIGKGNQSVAAPVVSPIPEAPVAEQTTETTSTGQEAVDHMIRHCLGDALRWVLPDKTTVVANSWAGLTSGTLQHAIDRDESGAAVSLAQLVITNTNAQGDEDMPGYDCGGFFAAGASFICPGHISSGMDWTTSAPCNFLCSTQDYRIYCMQK